MKKKECLKCRQVKSVEEFRKYANGALYCACNDCHFLIVDGSHRLSSEKADTALTDMAIKYNADHPFDRTIMQRFVTRLRDINIKDESFDFSGADNL